MKDCPNYFTERAARLAEIERKVHAELLQELSEVERKKQERAEHKARRIEEKKQIRALWKLRTRERRNIQNKASLEARRAAKGDKIPSKGVPLVSRYGSRVPSIQAMADLAGMTQRQVACWIDSHRQIFGDIWRREVYGRYAKPAQPSATPRRDRPDGPVDRKSTRGALAL